MTTATPLRTTPSFAPADFAERLQREHEKASSPAARKELGQYFTPAAIARYIASLFGPLPKRIRLLDPGAGTGTLSAAFCERVAAQRSPRTVEIHAYETDRRVLGCLSQTADACAEMLQARGHALDFRIVPKDFVCELGTDSQRKGLFGSGEAFDAVIMNPPYFKINKSSEHAQIMAEIVHGQPNVYALFMWIGARVLRDDGQMVAITPRSWCSGPYFKRFRDCLFSAVSLERVHLFESRREAFESAGVLQENVISCFRKRAQAPSIELTTSRGMNFDHTAVTRRLPASRVIDNSHGDSIVCLPTTDLELKVTETVESWPGRFATTGLRVSTGPVVTFRATEHLRYEPSEGAPLLSVHNVRLFETVWPLSKRGKPVALAINSHSTKLLVENSNYVLLRRFSAKEEARRLTASPVFDGDFPGRYLAFENHLNYVYHPRRALRKAEVIGLVALLNSRLLDIYFRTISGNTQVNAAEIRAIPFPSLEVVGDVGKAVQSHVADGPAIVEGIVLDTLGINGAIRSRLVG